ncbi:MAG: PadR family transcriptional regulator [Gemmatimonadota bacterium]|nr:PadR family transcriptional regulator [Gemmatimonadota bacterium]
MFKQQDWGFGAWANCMGPGVFGFGRPLGPKRRIVRKGELKYVLLELLADEPMHGYELIRRLEKESNGMYSPSPGSIYPTLQMLEDQGYVLSEQVDGKRVYRITDAGSEFRKEHTARTSDIFTRFVDMGERFTGSEMREITKSFIRLAQLSFDRAVAVKGDPEAMARLKSILESTANEIESAWPKADSVEVEV